MRITCLLALDLIGAALVPINMPPVQHQGPARVAQGKVVDLGGGGALPGGHCCHNYNIINNIKK